MSSIFVRTASVAAVVIGLGACVVDDDGDELEVETEVVEQSISGCGGWGCGLNGPKLSGQDWERANEDNQWLDGFRITRVTHASYPGRKFKLNVSNGRINATTNDLMWPTIRLYSHQAPLVTGLKIEVLTSGGQYFTLRIEELNRQLPYWNLQFPGTGYSYRMHYKIGQSNNGQDERFPENLCSDPPVEGDMGMNKFHTVVLEGDVFDTGRKAHTADQTTDPTADRNFYWGCAGHALAKAYLYRKVRATDPAFPAVSVPSREKTALVKMITSDYCGTGTAFTAQGEPVVFRDDVDAEMAYQAVTNELEARWNENGAVCLNTPRLIDTTNPDALAEFPDIELAIEGVCKRPPKCNDVGLSDDPYVDEAGVPFVSGNY